MICALIAMCPVAIATARQHDVGAVFTQTYASGDMIRVALVGESAEVIRVTVTPKGAAPFSPYNGWIPHTSTVSVHENNACLVTLVAQPHCYPLQVPS